MEGRGLTTLRKLMAAACAVAGLTLAFAGSAGASIPIGQLSPASGPGGCDEQFDILQFGLRKGTDYVVPETGTITSWSTRAGTTPGQQLTFKVFRPTSGGGYTVVAHDGPRPLTPGVVNTFKVAIAAKVGDIVGLNTTSATLASRIDCVFNPENSDEDVAFVSPGNAADGAAVAKPVDNRQIRVNLTATVLQPPEINTFGKVQIGSIAGGGSVVLEGNHFEEVTGVSFGGVAAKSFKVTDEHHVTAVAPAGKSLAGVAAAVSTLAGTATSTPYFYYSGCQVPKLTGKPAKAAKKAVKAAGCAAAVKLVRGSKRKKGKVLAQKPKPGTILAPGAKVSLKVGR